MNIIGCDYHPGAELIKMLDLETGEVVEKRLEHGNGEARRFYESLSEPALVGIEATGYTRWFAEMLEELGHELVVGEAAKIRAMKTRKQHHDRGDAAHLLRLLLRGDFPKIWVPPAEQRDVRVLIEHRHQLVELRTRAQNGLQAIALSYGVRRRRRLWSKAGQEELQKLPLREGLGRRREDLTKLMRQLSVWIKELDRRIEEEVACREDARRLMTHPGVGPQTALATVLVLGPVERFPDDRHLTSYLGLIPQEESSGGRQRFGHLTKQGNRLMRFLLVEAAGIASRYDPRLQRAYRRLAFRKGTAIAKVAVARKLAIRLYIMLRDGIDYEEFCRRGPQGSGRGSHAGMLGDVALV
jgi:transposase